MIEYTYPASTKLIATSTAAMKKQNPCRKFKVAL